MADVDHEYGEFSVEIDENELDREWVDQPRRYFRAAKMAADARRDMDMEKNRLELVVAELDLEIRTSPTDFGIEKVTEAAVGTAIKRHSTYQDQVVSLNRARHRLEVVQGWVQALDHRKTALSKLVDLFLANYFSKPTAPEGHREEMEGMEKKLIRQRARDRLNRARQE